MSLMNNKFGTCARCGAKNVQLHVMCLQKPVGNDEVELEFLEICEKDCFREWVPIWEKEVKGHPKSEGLGYDKFMDFFNYTEKVILS